MKTPTIERCFSSYLEKTSICGDIKPFLRVYIRLLTLFKADLAPEVLGIILEREKQLHGQSFDDSAFDKLRNSARGELNQDLKNGNELIARAALNRLIFCAMLDEDEVDVFYLTEPIFEFARNMSVSPVELEKILESEFVGFGVED